MSELFLGLDIGAESVKYVLLERLRDAVEIKSKGVLNHEKDPAKAVLEICSKFDVKSICAAAATGRFANRFRLTQIPQRAAQREGLLQILGDEPVTLVSIGCRGFSVFERRTGATDVFRENSRCSQGTGNFLRQLVERFDLNLQEADALCENVEKASALSGRCPVILKTDMTHLANKGEDRAAILAGVYDAICENVQALIKPRLCPRRLMLIGGVTRSSRIRRHFENYCSHKSLEFLPSDELSQLYLEALGAAHLAARGKAKDIPEGDLFVETTKDRLDRFASLRQYLPNVHRVEARSKAKPVQGAPVILGFDIGSTGSKAVAVLAEGHGSVSAMGDMVWEGYLRTNGNPVGAAKSLLSRFQEACGQRVEVLGFGVTGSGREIVASLLSACYGKSPVYVVNEIVAHAKGALAIDPNVDTIFEIGGQDAKYIRLHEGRIVDAAMNEACSAGTGSFIEEQGKKFKGVSNVEKLSEIALNSDSGVSLGQHCSVFMTEVIDEAISAGEPQAAIIAGIFDSIILNYFYRVKGNRSVGTCVFCQGMPFSSDALAAAVVRQTNAKVIVPPRPGLMGAYGIALLAREAKVFDNQANGYDLSSFLAAEIEERSQFVCRSTVGCGQRGNLCKIDKLRVRLGDKTFDFNWGGACSLWDKGGYARKLPNLCPNPFSEREALIEEIEQAAMERGNKTIAISEEFQTKSLFPFFVQFFYDLGFDLKFFKGGSQRYLKRGLEESNVQFCAPMQHFHGLASEMVESDADFIFFPMMRSGKFAKNEEYSVICPIVQSSADILKHDLKITPKRLLSPVIDFGPENYESKAFTQSCLKLANRLGVNQVLAKQALAAAIVSQRRFEESLLEIGRRALDFAKERNLDTVIVLGRNYTIHNNALNSNVPTILRNQGMLAIPVDCYPIELDKYYESIYWTYGQLNLRAATQIRQSPKQYALWCSNYACGPDSFNLHFLSYLMQGKPYTVIETDGHSGDAGTKTRVEAFIHCIEAYQEKDFKEIADLSEIERRNSPIKDIKKERRVLLIPPMGDNAEIIAAGFRGINIRCESLPVPTRKTLSLGRRYTSGKECLPMLITLGSLLERIEASDENEKLVYFMPRSYGPCRLGCYNLLDKIVLEQLGLSDKVSVWSLSDTDYSEGVPMATVLAIYTAFVACDTLMAALYDTRPIEKVAGKSEELYRKYMGKLISILENFKTPKLWQAYVIKEIMTGSFFGVAKLLEQAAHEFAEIRSDKRVPTVCVTGEIYVRNDPFANDFIIEALEKRGIRVLFAHFSEWLEYADVINREILKTATKISDKIASEIVRHVIEKCYQPMARALGWPNRHSVSQILKNAKKYLRPELVGEEILSIGTPLTAWRQRQIEGVINLGPLECMPSKIAESQFFHIAEYEGLPSLTLAFNGDPISELVIDDFAFEIHRSFAEKEKR